MKTPLSVSRNRARRTMTRPRRGRGGRTLAVLLLCLCALPMTQCRQAAQPAAFVWPDAKRAALSLSFDDARSSQIDVGMALLDRYGIKATFYVLPSNLQPQLDGWKQAVADGHEIGNHSLNHPCTGNFPWAKKEALAIEDYTVEKMQFELDAANRRIAELLGVTPRSFAYPCGHTSVGRAQNTKSYVPLVAEMFTSGRQWASETANDPAFCDLAQVTGIAMDGLDFEQLQPILETAKERGQWVVLVGHEIGQTGRETTRIAMLQELLPYALDPANALWTAPVGTVAEYVLKRRAAS